MSGMSQATLMMSLHKLFGKEQIKKTVNIMKNNDKITLSLGQLKRLIRESKLFNEDNSIYSKAEFNPDGTLVFIWTGPEEGVQSLGNGTKIDLYWISKISKSNLAKAQHTIGRIASDVRTWFHNNFEDNVKVDYEDLQIDNFSRIWQSMNGPDLQFPRGIGSVYYGIDFSFKNKKLIPQLYQTNRAQQSLIRYIQRRYPLTPIVNLYAHGESDSKFMSWIAGNLENYDEEDDY